MSSKYSIYVHYPYCRRICPYCDFNVYGPKFRNDADYFDALRAEASYSLAQPTWQGAEVKSFYFGGGTPSLAPPAQLASVLGIFQADFTHDIEITLEANPEDLKPDLISEWRALGINRISLGAQGVSKETIALLGRRHTFGDVKTGVEELVRAGINNISIDYIFGLPEQTREQLQADIESLLSLPVTHISAYELTVEKGTVFYRLASEGRFVKPPSDRVADIFKLLIDALAARGFEHYEISNFGLAGYRSRHNCAYWDYSNYLGLGAGAHSFSRGGDTVKRWSNLAAPSAYQNAELPPRAWSEDLSPAEQCFEYIYLRLRLLEGVSFYDYLNLFGLSFEDQYADIMNELVAQNYGILEQDSFKLSLEGRLLLDQILADPRWRQESE